MSVTVQQAPRDTLVTSWQPPPFTADKGERMAWVEEQILEGEGWLEDQPGYKNIAQNMRIFEGIFDDRTKSTLVTNSLKYDVRKFVETISEVREIASYGSDAPQYKKFAEMENVVARGVYLESFYPRQVRKMVQYATVFGRGYLWMTCKAGNYGWGERRFNFDALGPMDVMPVQIPSSNTVNEAYNVTVYTYMPIAEAHGRFPLFQSSLVPVAKMSLKSRVQARRQDYAARSQYGQMSSTRKWGNLFCEIRYTYVRDMSINRYGKELPMGDLGTSWFYKVPYVGQEIFGGIVDGKPTTRIARPEDCRIYPYLRLLVTCKDMDGPMYDGPAYDWHGMIPVVQLDVDDWAWEGMGRSLVQDVGSIEQTKRKLERKMDQVITTSLNPPMGYDRTSTGGPKIENFDIFQENVRAGVDGKPRDVLQSLLPEEVRVTNEHFTFLEYLDKARKQQLGLEDLGTLQNLKMNVSSDTADKAIESIGPIALSIAANMEYTSAGIGEMLKFAIPQWFDTKRIIQYVGAENIVPQVFDFDPASMIPSHMPDEMNDGEVPTTPSYYSKIERARRFAGYLRLMPVPGTLLKITQMQEQMKWLQLKRSGAPISWSTTLKKLDVANYGEVEGTTEREKYMNEQIEDLKFKAAAAQLAAQIMPQPPDGGEGGGPGKGGAHKGGRPPSGQKPPKLAQKGNSSGNPRTVVKES